MADPVAIVGGGLAGLVCARTLQRAGIPAIIFERDHALGGRLQTDSVDGFRLDRGFQVHFEAYPYARQELRQSDLKFRPFRAGAVIFDGEKLATIDRNRPLLMAFSTFLSLGDKLRMLKWSLTAARMTVEECRALPETSAEAYLKSLGFSSQFLERFARPFFGGVFLDRSLRISARQLAFVFKMISEGQVSVPAGGIAAIPAQIAADLAEGTVRLGTPVSGLVRDGDRVVGIELLSGEVVPASAVVVATESDVAARLTGLPLPKDHLASTCVYFEAPIPPIADPYLVLNAAEGRVNEVVPVSVVDPSVAPSGKHLVSATLLGEALEDDRTLGEQVKAEVAHWFPHGRVDQWRLLKVYRVRYAQMAQPPGFAGELSGAKTAIPGLYLSGEFTTNSSIDGALEAGQLTAKAVLDGLA